MSHLVEVFYPVPEALFPNEKFIVYRMNGPTQEFVVQSDRSAERAERSVETLNQHEENNGRQPTYGWRHWEDGDGLAKPRIKRVTK